MHLYIPPYKPQPVSHALSVLNLLLGITQRNHCKIWKRIKANVSCGMKVAHFLTPFVEIPFSKLHSIGITFKTVLFTDNTFKQSCDHFCHNPAPSVIVKLERNRKPLFSLDLANVLGLRMFHFIICDRGDNSFVLFCF